MHHVVYPSIQYVHTIQGWYGHIYIVDWLSCHNNTENRDQETAGMSISIHTISIVEDVLVFILIGDIRAAMSEDAELQMLQTHIIRSWPQTSLNWNLA